MRKFLITIIFFIGLGIFTYPFFANLFSTSAHQTIIEDYEKTVEEIPKVEKENIAKKGREHNKQLSEDELDFIDPFANGTDESGNKSYYDALNIGPSMGTLKVKELKIDLPIYHGTSESILSKGVGHLENTSLPLGNKAEYSVLTAHRGLPSSKLFRDIDKMEVGQEFNIQVLDEVMTYRVYDRKIVLPDETDWLKIDDKKSLVTLLSCEPYMINTHRLLVMGELISKEKIKETDKTQSSIEQNKQNHKIKYIIIAIIMALIILILFILYKRRKDERTGKNYEK